MYAEYMSGWSEFTILMLLLYDTDVDVRCKVLREHNFVIKRKKANERFIVISLVCSYGLENN